MPTLADRVDSGRVSFPALRLALAAIVVLAHSIRLAVSLGPDDTGRAELHVITLGSLAVDGFFVLAGYLVLGSYLHARSASGFLWRRALRILPGFWACLIVTAFVFGPVTAWLTNGVQAYAWVGPDSATSYVGRDALLLMRQFEITGGFAGEAANGSLHTLFYLFLCYLGVVTAGALGLWQGPRRRAAWVLVGLWLGLEVSALIVPDLIAGHPARALLVRYGAMFAVAALLHLCADRIGVRRRWVAVAAAVVVLAITLSRVLEGQAAVADARGLAVYGLLAPPALAYLVLVVGGSPRLARIGARRDLSYGVYLYAWPVQVTLFLAGAGAWWPPAFFLAGLMLALGLAYLSWTWVEAPALRLKGWSLRRRPVAGPVAGCGVGVVVVPEGAPAPVVPVRGPR